MSGKQTALLFTVLMVVFVLYGEYQRRTASPEQDVSPPAAKR